MRAHKENLSSIWQAWKEIQLLLLLNEIRTKTNTCIYNASPIFTFLICLLFALFIWFFYLTLFDYNTLNLMTLLYSWNTFLLIYPRRAHVFCRILFLFQDLSPWSTQKHHTTYLFYHLYNFPSTWTHITHRNESCRSNSWFKPLSRTSSSCRPSRPCLRCSSSSRLFASPETKTQKLNH